LKNEERKEEIKKLNLDSFDNNMHFNVPGIGFLGSPFSVLEKQLAMARKPKKSTPMQLKIQ
jgi:hypothetical protein